MKPRPGANVPNTSIFDPRKVEFEKKQTEKATQRHDLELDFIKKQLKRDKE